MMLIEMKQRQQTDDQMTKGIREIPTNDDFLLNLCFFLYLIRIFLGIE